MPRHSGEPLPIWFFVGLILAIYGFIILCASFVYPRPDTVLGHTRPALWWGALTLLAGGVFLLIGLKAGGVESSESGDASKEAAGTEPPRAAP